jgi:hypothetical protein
MLLDAQAENLELRQQLAERDAEIERLRAENRRLRGQQRRRSGTTSSSPSCTAASWEPSVETARSLTTSMVIASTTAG